MLAAIDEKPQELSEELGDVLLQVLLHSQIAGEAKTFTLEDVVSKLHAKLIERHPHIFKNVVAKDTKTVTSNWEKIKSAKKSSEGLFSGVPDSLPALLKAYRIGIKASRVGLDWKSADKVMLKVKEELSELQTALNEGTNIEEEVGDMLFALAQLARQVNVEPEIALQNANRKFMSRVRDMEKMAKKSLHELDEKALDELWSKVKTKHAGKIKK